MAVQDIRLGRAFVELFLKSNLAKGLGQLRKQLDTFSSRAIGIGGTIAGVGATALAAFTGPVKAASDFAETVSKFKAVFGEQSDAVRAWADDYRKQVGRAEADTLNALATFQSFFLGLGIGADNARELSKEMMSLGVDFASFNNIQDPEAFERFISALSGSGEVLAMYGVNIMEAALNQKLLALGFPTIAKGATEVQKVMARMSIIRESMGKQGAVGDAIRTAGSFANQMKALSAEIGNVSKNIGEALIPALAPLVKIIADIGRNVADWIQKNEKIVITIAAVAAGVTAAGLAIAGLGVAAKVTALAIGLLTSPLGLVTIAIGAGIVAWAKYTESGQGAMKALTDAWGGIVNALSAGDLELAGKIAFEGLNVAWQTILQSMAELWDNWSQGVVNSFTSAMRAVLDAWQQTTGAIANWLIKDSAQREQGRANYLNRQILNGASSRITEAEAAQARIRSGETLSDAEKKQFGGGTEDDLQRYIEDHAKQISVITGEKYSVMKMGAAAIDQQLTRTADGFRKFLDSMDSASEAVAGNSEALINAKNALKESVLKAENKVLDDLFASAVADMDADKKKGSGQVDAAASALSAGGSQFGSFSAAGLLAGSRGARPEDRIVAELKESRKLDKETLKTDKAILASIQKPKYQLVN